MTAPADQEDLFESGLNDRLARQAPLAARMRPRTIDEVVGQEHLLGPGRPLRALIEADRLSSIVLWGPPGTGKTTLAPPVASATSAEITTLSSATSRLDDRRR